MSYAGTHLYCSDVVRSICIPLSDWASWTQAVFAGVAIVVAVLVPVIRHCISSRKLQQSLALALYNDFDTYAASVNGFLKNSPLPDLAADHWNDVTAVPPMVGKTLRELHLLGNVSRYAVDAVQKILRARSYLNDWKAGELSGHPNSVREGLVDKLREASAAASNAEVKLRKVLREPPR